MRSARVAADLFELFVLAPRPSEEAAAIRASYRSARVLAPFPRRGGVQGARWRRIIRVHERTLAALDGRGRGRGLPQGRELRAFGRDLFETLLPAELRTVLEQTVHGLCLMACGLGHPLGCPSRGCSKQDVLSEFPVYPDDRPDDRGLAGYRGRR